MDGHAEFALWRREMSPTTAAPNRQAGAYICNLVPSRETERDWRLADSVRSGVFTEPAALPASVDLRHPWWSIHDQEATGSCVGWATADGLVRYHLVRAKRIAEDQLLSARYVWMASKETDTLTTRPETFIESAGTTLKAAVDVVRRYGAALDTDLPFHITTRMYGGDENVFYSTCAQRRIAAYYNLGKHFASWKAWLSTHGPILVGLSVDDSWDNATATGGRIDTFHPATVRGGHAVTIVGYRTDGRFIVRNSWGTGWGDGGFGYVTPAYVTAGFFDESYGITL
jgi:C1A family cysteine protease